MMHRALLAAGLLLLLVTSASAQTGGTTRDPVTGNWGANGLTYLELQFDGKSTVSGTAIWRHGEGDEQRTPIKTGTFDTQTGALKLTGEAKNRDGKTVQYLIEGKIVKDTVTGTFDVGGERGEFEFTRQ